MKWEPIETAPKDGRWILLTGGHMDDGWDIADHPLVVAGQWTDYLNGYDGEKYARWQFAWYDGGYYGTYIRPTHWMLLPEPPDAC